MISVQANLFTHSVHLFNTIERNPLDCILAQSNTVEHNSIGCYMSDWFENRIYTKFNSVLDFVRLPKIHGLSSISKRSIDYAGITKFRFLYI